ncbi:glycosyltransferase family 2 protein [Sphingomonas sp. URHD0057]|uniref:glycosyltransferase family 2 protein n=1 Tax=Sphingomonas sp. URHD0057 TaxID=1380389 RepID=UPI0006867749|nr:glycosyltransferase [Sphingomonas sp. URHD0057]
MAAAPETAPVAVVIPTYNHAAFLPAAIRSVLAQKPCPLEIIIVDDGSDDHPEEAIKTFPGVRLVRQRNAGLSAARNRGVRETSAPFLLFLDADDRLLPGAIASGLASLASNPLAALTYGAYDIVDAPTRKVTKVAFRPVPTDAFAAFLAGNPVGMHGCVLYRRRALEGAGGFREGLSACEDYELYLRLSRDYPVLCHDDRCAQYWHHGGNMSRDAAFMLRSALRVLRDYREEADRRGHFNAYRAGVAGWKLFYTGVWAGLVREHRPGAAAMGLKLLRLAPATLIAKACSAALRVIR